MKSLVLTTMPHRSGHPQSWVETGLSANILPKCRQISNKLPEIFRCAKYKHGFNFTRVSAWAVPGQKKTTFFFDIPKCVMIPIRYNQSPRPWCEIHKCASGGLCCREKIGKFQMTWAESEPKAAVFRYPAHSLQEKVLLETDVAMRSGCVPPSLRNLFHPSCPT